ncbi:hypothetical protein FRC17_005614 [Serendipita sp. 399]|nr:hypothetical protein FRC17_005614 [Serendipita sp. 399]
MKTGRLEKEWLNGLIELVGTPQKESAGDDHEMQDSQAVGLPGPATDAEGSPHARALKERSKRLGRGPLGESLVRMQGQLYEAAVRLSEQSPRSPRINPQQHSDDDMEASTESSTISQTKDITKRAAEIACRLEKLEEELVDADTWATEGNETTKEDLKVALDRSIRLYLEKSGEPDAAPMNVDTDVEDRDGDQESANAVALALNETKAHRRLFRDSRSTAEAYLSLMKNDMKQEDGAGMAKSTEKVTENWEELDSLDKELDTVLGSIERRQRSVGEISSDELSMLVKEMVQAQYAAGLSSQILPEPNKIPPMPNLQGFVQQLQDGLVAQWNADFKSLETASIQTVQRLNGRAQRQQAQLEAEKDRRMGLFESLPDVSNDGIERESQGLASTGR